MPLCKKSSIRTRPSKKLQDLCAKLIETWEYDGIVLWNIEILVGISTKKYIWMQDERNTLEVRVFDDELYGKNTFESLEFQMSDPKLLSKLIAILYRVFPEGDKAKVGD
jgi:hypothetical protein